VGRADDDVCDGRRHAHLDARVALLGKLALEELVELRVEDSIGDELSALGAVTGKRCLISPGNFFSEGHEEAYIAPVGTEAMFAVACSVLVEVVV